MSEEKKTTVESESSGNPLIFISHDSRDAELAEAFSKLLKSVSAGMLKSFRSSDKKGSEGIEFGDEWYKRLMERLESASDVVCLLTERSLDRPWILYEAGVAKGKMGTPVHGVALGVSLTKVATGPFYQFQNSDDSDESLAKLVLQLCRRVSGLEPDTDVVKAQVQLFRSGCEGVLKKLRLPEKKVGQEPADESALAKVLEEMKLMVRELPGRLEQSAIGQPERLQPRHFKGRYFIEVLRVFAAEHNPLAILILACLCRDDFPWLYEIGVDTYRAILSQQTADAHKMISNFQAAISFTVSGPLSDALQTRSRESMLLVRELSRMLDRHLATFEVLPRGRRIREAPTKPDQESD